MSPNWDQNEWHGFVTNSVVALVVRKGNPKNIQTWDDLIKPGVQVITPNPFSSGGARWNIMAAYGAQIKQGKSPAEAQAYLTQLFKHVVVQDKSARDALQTFTGGKGDVLVSYENEAIIAQQKGKAVDYVVPDQTILIQNPLAETKDAKPGRPRRSSTYLHTPAAQKIFAAKGYRPVIPLARGQEQVPHPVGPVHDRRSGRLDEGDQAVLRPAERRRDEDRAGTWGSPLQRVEALPGAGGAPPCRGRAPSRPRPPLAGGFAVLYLSVIVLLPLAAVVDESLERRARRVLARGHRARGRAPRSS